MSVVWKNQERPRIKVYVIDYPDGVQRLYDKRKEFLEEVCRQIDKETENVVLSAVFMTRDEYNSLPDVEEN